MKTARSKPETASSGKRTHIERNQEAESRFLEATMRLVAERGTARTTLADVAEASGYSSGLVSHYFDNKAGLLLALVGHVQRLVMRQMGGSAKRATGLETILGMASHYLRPNRELQLLQRTLYALRIEAMLTTDKRVVDRMATYYQECEAFVERQLRIAIERGEINPAVDPAAYSVVFLCTLQGIIAQSLVNPNFDLPMAREGALASIERTLALPKTTRRRRQQAARQ